MHKRDIPEKSKMNEKLKVAPEALDNVSRKYPETKKYFERDMEKVCEKEKVTLEEVFYLNVFV